MLFHQRIEEQWNFAPNPKPTNDEKRAFGQFVSLYTAFSESFAEFALAALLEFNCKSVLDPFSGSGTVARAALAHPLEVELRDLNPFLVLAAITCGQNNNARRNSIARLEELSGSVERRDGTLPELTEDEFIKPIKFLGSLQDQVRSVDPDLAPDLTCLFARLSYELQLAKRSKGKSNPTWFVKKELAKKGDEPNYSFVDHCRKLKNYLEDLAPAHPDSLIKYGVRDAANTALGQNRYDAIVTSPPYLSRLDYIIHNYPAVSPLMTELGIEERQERKLQIGTNLIRHKNDRTDHFPQSVRKCLESIKNHTSYASSNYYYWGFLYYFDDMKRFLDAASSSLVDGGHMAMVVQDSYYKDLHIPLADLLAELAKGAALDVVAIKRFAVRRHMGMMNPKQHGQNLEESAILFRKS